MKPERLIEILNEEIEKDSRIVTDTDIESGVKLCLSRTALTAMTRAVEEETARLRECEAIVRELAGTDFSDDLSMQDIRDLARQWARENPE